MTPPPRWVFSILPISGNPCRLVGTNPMVRLRQWEWKELPTYNGFAHAERVRGWQLVNLLVELGQIDEPRQCAISGTTEGIISHHSECYYSWAPYALAQPIHFALHRRFKQPEPWLQLVERYAETGDEWWANLAMVPVDIASQRRTADGDRVADIFTRAPIPAGLQIDRREIYPDS